MSNVIEFSLKMIDDFSATMGKASSSMSNMEKALAALGVTAVAYKTIDLAKTSIENADAMGDAATAAGVAVEQFSMLTFAADYLGSSSTALTTGIRMLNKAIGEGGITPAATAIQGLGVATADADGKLRPVVDVLFDIADEFAASEDGAGKAAYAMAIFGKSGTDLIPMLNQGSAAIKDMMGKAQALGLVITDEFAQSAGDAKDNIELLSGVVSGAFNVAMKEVSPVIAQITGQMVDLVTEGGAAEEMGRAIAAGMRLIMTAGISVVGVFKSVRDLLGGLAAAAMAIASGEFSQAGTIIKESVFDIRDNITETFDQVNAVWDESAQAANAAAAKQIAALRGTGRALDSLDDKKKQAEAAEKAHAKALEETKTLIEKQRTALEEHEAVLARINALKAEGAMTSEQAALALERENEQWLQSQARVQEYGMTATSVMESLQVLIEQKLATMQSFAMQYAQAMLAAFDQLSQGIGDSVAEAIVEGASLMTMLENVLKQFVKQMIATWIQMQVQRVIYAQLGSKTEAAAASSKIAYQAGIVYTATYADVAQNMSYGWLYGAAIAAAAAAAAEGGGMAFVAAGGAAHGGLDFVPNESTFLLQQGERVLSPRQNEDLTAFLEGTNEGGAGNVVIQNLTIHVLENATNVDAFSRMDKIALRNTLGYPIIDALNEMWNIGVRPDFASGAK